MLLFSISAVGLRFPEKWHERGKYYFLIKIERKHAYTATLLLQHQETMILSSTVRRTSIYKQQQRTQSPTPSSPVLLKQLYSAVN